MLSLSIRILFVLFTLGSFIILISLATRGNPRNDMELRASLRARNQGPNQDIEQALLGHLKHRFRVGAVIIAIPLSLSLIAGLVCLLLGWEGTSFFFTIVIINLVVLGSLKFIYYLNERRIST